MLPLTSHQLRISVHQALDPKFPRSILVSATQHEHFVDPHEHDDDTANSFTSSPSSMSVDSLNLSLPHSSLDTQVFSVPLSPKQEALEYMHSQGLDHHDRVACPRPACRQSVPHLKALIVHLDQHRIDDRSFICPSCSHRYETKKEMSMHLCGGWSKHRSGSASHGLRSRISTFTRRLSIRRASA
ncbi:hypothetical protein DL96DRAFT_1812350 [Flagelloscypha sp. PMI_526]|nr:hypothetical protein DL96DRAFT_1812350 [Flagelloscypha sp. PMI_526]